MRALAIDVLADFDLDLAEDDETMPSEPDALEVEPLGVSLAVETQRKIDEACAQVRAELRAEADDRLCRALDQQAARFTVELDTARRAWAEEEATVLAKAVSAAMADLKAQIAETAAAALRPFLAEGAREMALRDLIEQLGRILTDPNHPALTISGPADLLARVSAALAYDAGSVSFRPDGHPDVRVVAGTTIIETRIQEWIARLDRAGE